VSCVFPFCSYKLLPIPEKKGCHATIEGMIRNLWDDKFQDCQPPSWPLPFFDEIWFSNLKNSVTKPLKA